MGVDWITNRVGFYTIQIADFSNQNVSNNNTVSLQISDHNLSGYLTEFFIYEGK